MELEQTANFLKIKAGPLAAVLPATLGETAAEIPPDTGFATLMQDLPPPTETQNTEPSVINMPQAFPARPEDTPLPEVSLTTSPDTEEIPPSEADLPPASIAAPPALENPIPPLQPDAAPLETEAAESPVLPLPISAALPPGPQNAASPMQVFQETEPKPDEKPALIADSRSAKTVEKTAEIIPPAIAVPKSNPSAIAAPVPASLAEFFAPRADKKPDPIQAETTKYPTQIAANRITAPQTASNTPVVALAAAQPVFSLSESGVEPDFTLALRTERASFEGGALLPQASRTAAPIQAQLAAQFPTQIAANTQKVIELRLDPPELGRVVIHITTQDQSVTAQIVADRPDTLELMRRHAEFFTNTLDKAGFSQSNLSFQQGGGQPQSKAMAEFQLTQADSLSEDPPASSAPARLIEGRLDIRL